MLLVVDAEVIFASLIKRGFTLDLIRLLTKKGYKLVTPEYIFEEVRRKEEKLLKYSKVDVSKLWFLLFLLLKKIEPISKKEYSKFLGEAKKPSPFEDFPYSALALKYKSLALDVKIWSNDPKFKNALKGRISFVSTKQLVKEVGLSPLK